MKEGVRPRLATFLGLALTLGFTGFGGGYAVAQRIRHALVDKHKWLDDEAFVEALAVSSSLPGTTATNLLTLVGYRFGGVRAAVGAAAAFLAPSVALMIAFGAAYNRLRHLPALASVLAGMGVATVGVIGAVAVDMRRYALRGRLGWIIASVSAALLVVDALNLLEVIALAGLFGAIWMRPVEPRVASPPDDDSPGSLRAILIAIPPMAAMPAVVALFFVFARIGIATFGGGIAMISPMEHEIVHVRGWLDDGAFRDAIVLGQITPGPIAISATFIGYRVDGLVGAAVATVGMFGPPFLVSIAAAHSMNAFRRSSVVSGFLSAVAPAVVGAIVAACVALFHTAVHDVRQGIVAAAVFALLVVRPKLSPLLPIAIAGALEVLFA